MSTLNQDPLSDAAIKAFWSEYYKDEDFLHRTDEDWETERRASIGGSLIGIIVKQVVLLSESTEDAQLTGLSKQQEL